MQLITHLAIPALELAVFDIFSPSFELFGIVGGLEDAGGVADMLATCGIVSHDTHRIVQQPQLTPAVELEHLHVLQYLIKILSPQRHIAYPQMIRGIGFGPQRTSVTGDAVLEIGCIVGIRAVDRIVLIHRRTRTSAPLIDQQHHGLAILVIRFFELLEIVPVSDIDPVYIDHIKARFTTVGILLRRIDFPQYSVFDFQLGERSFDLATEHPMNMGDGDRVDTPLIVWSEILNFRVRN